MLCSLHILCFAIVVHASLRNHICSKHTHTKRKPYVQKKPNSVNVRENDVKKIIYTYDHPICTGVVHDTAIQRQSACLHLPRFAHISLVCINKLCWYEQWCGQIAPDRDKLRLNGLRFWQKRTRPTTATTTTTTTTATSTARNVFRVVFLPLYLCWWEPARCLCFVTQRPCC